MKDGASAIDPPFDAEAAVRSVFEACRATGASLATCHEVAALAARELERPRWKRKPPPTVDDIDA